MTSDASRLGAVGKEHTALALAQLQWSLDMRRVVMSVLIAVVILAVPMMHFAALPSVRLCPEGWTCGPTSVESGVSWLFMPGFLIALPLYFLVDVSESLVLAVVAFANIAFYASVVWLLLTVRTRRLERARTPTLPL